MDAVIKLFAHIERDTRHHQTVKIIFEPIEQRAFGDWTMTGAGLTQEGLSRIDGVNDFFTKGEMFARLGSGRAKRLLSAFRDGRWRKKLTVKTPATAS